jgi:protein-disulfide isomerase
VSREAKIMIAVLVLIVGGMVAIFVLGGGSSTPSAAKVDATKLSNASSHTDGSGSVQLVEFGDFQCPACGNAEPWVEQARKDFAGKLTIVFRNFPLTQLHPNAMNAAEVAEAAGAQGKYWEMHDKLYATQKDWSALGDPTSIFASYAQAIGVPDIAKFQADLAAKTYANAIAADVADGNSLGVNATPTFYVNGVQPASVASYQDLKHAITSAQKAK